MPDLAQPITTRDAILNATDRLLAKCGYKKMTIDDLATEVGIGKGSVYLHFKSKEDIALSHVDRIIERLKQRLVEIRQSRSAVDERLKRMLIERVVYRVEAVQHYKQGLDDLLAQLRPRLLDRRHKYFEDEAHIFAELLAEGKASGEFAMEDSLETAKTLLDATNALLPYSLSPLELGNKKEIDRKARLLAELLLRGLLQR